MYLLTHYYIMRSLHFRVAIMKHEWHGTQISGVENKGVDCEEFQRKGNIKKKSKTRNEKSWESVGVFLNACVC